MKYDTFEELEFAYKLAISLRTMKETAESQGYKERAKLWEIQKQAILLQLKHNYKE